MNICIKLEHSVLSKKEFDEMSLPISKYISLKHHHINLNKKKTNLLITSLSASFAIYRHEFKEKLSSCTVKVRLKALQNMIKDWSNKIMSPFRKKN